MYAHIARTLQGHIRAGVYKPGAKLPGEIALAAQFGVARATVQRALRELRRDGWIISQHGRGHFVTGLPEHGRDAVAGAPPVLGWLRPPVMLVEPAEWATGALWRLFVAHLPLGLLDPAAPLGTARDDFEVYVAALRGSGLDDQAASERAAALVVDVDRVLAAVADALGDPSPAAMPAVVPQLRADWTSNLIVAG